MADFEEGLESARLDELDADGTLAEAVADKRAERRLQAKQLRTAVHWADLHAVLTHPVATKPGCERLARLGGDGTPEVAEFAPAEFGLVQGMTDHAAKKLIADALDLRHRLPALWDRTQAGEVDVWMARRVAEQTRALSKDAAAKVDARIGRLAGSLTWRRLKDIVAAAVLAADPPKAHDDAERAAAAAGVFLDPEPVCGYQTMIINARAGDVQALNKLIGLLSRGMKILGHEGTPDQRRAEAAGVIADPQAALDLLAKAEQVRQAQCQAAAARRAGEVALAEQIEQTLPATSFRVDQKPFMFRSATLYVHLAHETLHAILNGQPYAGAGAIRVEDLGPIIAEQVKQWLGHANLTVKPVIDLAGVQPVDRYEVSPSLSEAIGLMNPADYSPYGSSLSRRQENDHTIPYVPMNRGGPPGQTDPAKMAKLTRPHHRLKTFAGWTVTHIALGVWLWRSPHGYHFLVHHHGTTPLGRLELRRPCRLRCGS